MLSIITMPLSQSVQWKGYKITHTKSLCVLTSFILFAVLVLCAPAQGDDPPGAVLDLV